MFLSFYRHHLFPQSRNGANSRWRRAQHSRSRERRSAARRGRQARACLGRFRHGAVERHCVRPGEWLGWPRRTFQRSPHSYPFRQRVTNRSGRGGRGRRRQGQSGGPRLCGASPSQPSRSQLGLFHRRLLLGVLAQQASEESEGAGYRQCWGIPDSRRQVAWRRRCLGIWGHGEGFHQGTAQWRQQWQHTEVRTSFYLQRSCGPGMS